MTTQTLRRCHALNGSDVTEGGPLTSDPTNEGSRSPMMTNLRGRSRLSRNWLLLAVAAVAAASCVGAATAASRSPSFRCQA